MKALAGIIPLLLAGAGEAATLFESEKNRVDLTGYADIYISSQELNTEEQKESDDGQMSSGATRFRFFINHELNPQISVNLLSEYFVNLVNGDFERSNVFVNRLGSIGFTGDRFGDLRFGKQWAPMNSLVLGVVDGPINSDSDAAGIYNLTDGGLRGVGRLDKGIVYQNRWGDFGVGFQGGLRQQAVGQAITLLDADDIPFEFPAAQAERDWNGGVAFNWVSDFGLTVGAGFTQSELDVQEGVYYGVSEDEENKKMEVAAIGISYNYQDQLRISSSIIPYARYYHVTGYDGQGTRTDLAELVPDSYGGDIWVRYRFANTLTPFIYLSYIDMDEICRELTGSGEETQCANRGDSDRFTGYIGVQYWLTNQITLALSYDYTDFETAIHSLDDNDRIGVKIRYWYDPNISGW